MFTTYKNLKVTCQMFYRFCRMHMKHSAVIAAPMPQNATRTMATISALLQNVALCVDLWGVFPNSANSIIRGMALLESHGPLGLFSSSCCCW